MRLTARQQAILDFIQARLREQGLPPTRAEIVSEFGFASPNAAQCHLRALADKGAITLHSNTARGIVPTDHWPQRKPQRPRNRATLQLPVIGRVQAGRPILAVAHQERELSLDPSVFSPQPDYLLRVQGHSMQGAGIEEGDLLAVHRTPEARAGQIVVARLDDEVTVKRLVKDRHGWQLVAAHPDFPPVRLRADQAPAIEGWGVGVIRAGLS